MPGKYRCFSSNGSTQLFMTGIELRSGGTYLAFGKEGRYSFDAATATIIWQSGWAQENKMMGKVEGNAVPHYAQCHLFARVDLL